MLFGILGGQIATAIAGETLAQPVDMESKFLWGILFEVINALILVLIYAQIFNCLPGAS